MGLKHLTTDDIGDSVAPNTWKPPGFALGSVITSGVTAFNASGAGHLYTFDPNQDDEILLNVELSHNGMDYDGSDIDISLVWQKFSAGAGNVKWEMDYAFLEDGEDNYTESDGTETNDITVTGRTAREQYTDTFGSISGPSGSTHLQLTIRRNGTGAGGDSYNGDADVYTLKMT